MSEIELDRATPGDLELVVELEESSFEIREQWSEAGWDAELRGGDRRVWVVRTGAGGLSGVISTRVIGSEAELMRVVVVSSERRRGIGSALVEHAVADAHRLGARRMLLEVRADNAAAGSLYHRLGFTEIDRRPGYYGPGSDALVLRRRWEDPDDA